MNAHTEKRAAIPALAMGALNAAPMLLMGGQGLLDQYSAHKQSLRHPQTPRAAGMAGMGGSVSAVSSIGAPKTSLMGSGLTPMSGEDKSGGMSVMGSAIQVLDEFKERVLAFDWGAEQFCKAAGFDEEDTKIMMALVKEAARVPKVSTVRAPAAKAQEAKRLAGQPMPGVIPYPYPHAAPASAAAAAKPVSAAPTPGAVGKKVVDPVDSLEASRANFYGRSTEALKGPGAGSRVGGADQPSSVAASPSAPAPAAGVTPAMKAEAKRRVSEGVKGPSATATTAPAAVTSQPRAKSNKLQRTSEGELVPKWRSEAAPDPRGRFASPEEFSKAIGSTGAVKSTGVVEPAGVQPADAISAAARAGKAPKAPAAKGKTSPAPAGGLGEAPPPTAVQNFQQATAANAPAAAAPAPEAKAAPAAPTAPTAPVAPTAPEPTPVEPTLLGRFRNAVDAFRGKQTLAQVPPAEAVQSMRDSSAQSALPISQLASKSWGEMNPWTRRALMGAGAYGGYQALTEGGTYGPSEWFSPDAREEHAHKREMNTLRRKIELEKKQREAGVFKGTGGDGGGGGKFRDPWFTPVQITTPTITSAIMRQLGNPNVNYINQLPIFGGANDPMLGSNIATTINQHRADQFKTLINDVANEMNQKGMNPELARGMVMDWVKQVDDYQRRVQG